MSALVFQHVHRVSYRDCTLGNHVYYSRYLDLCENARGEFFRSLGHPFLLWQQREVLFPVIEAWVRYKAPARYDDLISIETFVTRMEGIRLTFGYRLMDSGRRLLVEAWTAHICSSLQEKPRRLPPELHASLQPYLRPGNETVAGGGRSDNS